ncbi:MAG TPA: hypothetical protein VKB90_06745 [Candidatus Acidoferrum sp.]|nr:hypothetical protein [Candidatus Acidoferrum sp.]
MRAEASSPSLKKVWKSVVGSTVTAVTVIGGFFGIYSFMQGYSRYDLTGQWTITNTIVSTSYQPYKGLKLGYTVFLTQHGTDITGTGEKESEDGKDLPSGAHTPIEVNGSISGRKITATFIEKGAKRESEGTFSWTYQAKTKGLAGTFTSTAADTSGPSTASRVLP